MAVVERRRVRVTGTVQGVGFRPFVYRIAVALGLSGYVRNDSAGVLIEVQGCAEEIAELCRQLIDSPPPLARVTELATTQVPPSTWPDGFIILDSDEAGAPDAAVSVDTATCADCLIEIDDPANRRFGYAFTNCTNCGPRYTIVVAVPYDRPATTMAGFTMCRACQREYDDPADRRFHAQPNACPSCGPSLTYCDPSGAALAHRTDALDASVAALAAGAILAVKGVGGFHLAVDATQPRAVSELRRRKARDDKPFAVMVADMTMARALVQIEDKAAQTVLSSPARPIVIAPRRVGEAPITSGGAPSPIIAPAVAPGLPELGLMLPYSPLHHLLLARMRRPIVMTSGNLSDDPIAYTDDDAIARLGPLVDGILTHDRPIHIRCDDSVVRASGGCTQVLRRSRGFAPEPMRLPFDARRQVLAVGAELKNTVSVAKGRSVVASHHIGDLEHLSTYQSFEEALRHLCALFGVVPEIVAHDLHPEYLSTKLAVELDLPARAIQHHHAHVASCLVDHQRTEPVLGVAFDGLGLGPDGTLWGGEFLVADLSGFERVGHLAPVPLPGGTAAIREPWRMAVSWANHSSGRDAARALGARFDHRADAVVSLLAAASTPQTTSVGRLFDAVSAVIVGRRQVSYEGQAAIELEALARATPIGQAPAYPVDLGWVGGTLVVDPGPLVAAVLAGRASMTAGRASMTADDPAASVLAAAFHESIGRATAQAAASLARAHGLDTVALTGGVFQNARLTEVVAAGLTSEGLSVLLHRHVPPNDGGISIGQAAIAAYGD